MTTTNVCSRTWFRTFLATVPPAATEREVAFLRRRLPLESHGEVLDACCGAGRHALALARAGYRVTGLDRDRDVLAAAPEAAPGNPRYVVADVREVAGWDERFDAVLVLWQSLGYFDRAGNAALLAAFGERLRPGGRLVLDLYHRAFFEAHQGRTTGGRGGPSVVERKRIEGRFLTVELDYGEGVGDRFRWELFTPEEIEGRASAAGLRPVLACRGFDETLPPSPDVPRMQVVFEKPGGLPRGTERAAFPT